MKIEIKRLISSKEIAAAEKTITDFSKSHSNILSIKDGSLFIEFPVDFVLPDGQYGISEFQCRLIFNAGGLFIINLKSELHL